MSKAKQALGPSRVLFGMLCLQIRTKFIVCTPQTFGSRYSEEVNTEQVCGFELIVKHHLKKPGLSLHYGKGTPCSWLIVGEPT